MTIFLTHNVLFVVFLPLIARAALFSNKNGKDFFIDCPNVLMFINI